MIGLLLGGRYEILERIGSGGMSVVYRARCTILNRTVAVKVLRSQYAEDEEFVRRFRREAMAAASLCHPNIVSIYDVGQDDEVHYIVMELVEGETLRDRIRRERLRPAEAAEIAIQICDALTCAHRAHVVHRDIKPLNIILTGDARVKVTDFGIAHAGAAAPITSDGTVLGSAHYLSPEQARGAVASHSSDIYSLGVVLYEMVTGRVPFEGDSPVAVAMKHATEDLPRPSRIDPRVSPMMERIILSAMARDPEKRYQSAREMRDDLAEFLGLPQRTGNGSDDRSGNGGDGVSDRKRDRRKRRSWIKWAVVVVLLGALGFVAAVGSRQATAWLDVPIVPVPDVVGLNETDAVSLLSGSGLGATVTARRHDPDIAAGVVLSQQPRGGEQVRQGREIELTVSMGPRLVEGGVPDLVRLHYREVEARIRTLGLVVGRVTRDHHTTVPVDYVVGQHPRPGTMVPEGTVIDLEISLGPIPLDMPKLIGQSLDTARQRLAQLELELGIVTERPSDQPEGTVLEQFPGEGEPAAVGTIVDLVVSSGPQIPEQKTVIWVAVPGDTGMRQVAVELQDIAGRRMIYEARHRAGERFELTVSWKGDSAQLRVFIDGDLFAERVWP